MGYLSVGHMLSSKKWVSISHPVLTTQIVLAVP